MWEEKNNALFESSDILNQPYECFIYDTARLTFPIRPHWHYFAEMIYVLEGTAGMYDGEQLYNVPKDGFIFFHSKSVHAIYAVDKEPLFYVVIKVDINKLNATPSYSPKLNNLFKSAQEKKMPVYFDPDFSVSHNCKKLFLDCVTELNEKNYGYDLLIQSNLYNIMMLIIRKWQSMGFSIENSIFEKENVYDIDNITEYIDQHIEEPISVEGIAETCGISYSCFAKKFKKLYGMSCKEYIERFRIFKVEDYLVFTDFDLNYISQETGYADCSHMIRQFKKYRGITPKQFRLTYGSIRNAR